MGNKNANPRPSQGAGIARVLGNPKNGNLAVALLARRQEPLQQLATSLKQQTNGGVFEPFSADISKPDTLKKAFEDIKNHQSFSGLKLRMAIFSVKHSSKKPFMEETYEEFTESMTSYVGGAFTFSQLTLARFFADHGEEPLSPENPEKKGTLIFTGTLGALRCNKEFAAYGAGRASVRQLSQTLGREMSAKGVHVVHTIANGGIGDNEGKGGEGPDQAYGKKMAAEAVGETYLWLHNQRPTLWTSELDMRPACESY